MTDREKELIKLNKRYLNLIYQKAQYKLAEKIPPDALLNEIVDVERKLAIISRALDS